MGHTARKPVADVIAIDRDRVNADLHSEGLLTVREAAKQLHVHESTVYDHCADGSLPSTKVFNRRMVSAKAVRILLERGFSFDESWSE